MKEKYTLIFTILAGIILTTIVGSLSGCLWDNARDTVIQTAREGYDRALVDAEFVICDAASIGSIKRRYGVSDERAKAWRDLCEQSGADKILVGPEE